MQRENRYMVLKLSDIEKLPVAMQQTLCEVDSEINFKRQQANRGLLNAVVVEADWPEYEPTWQAIEKRVDSA